MVGRSPAILGVKEIAASVGRRRSTVMILGETGSGKEMLARYIHRHSERVGQPFVAVDLSSLTDTLFESQMFGHRAGAFTGAVRDAIGFIRAANHGTLFLDEVGDLPPHLQAKLLRVLQEREVIPVGESRPHPVDIRVIAATHRNLRAMVGAGTFRQDLFFRLNVVTLMMPPLRERLEDIPLLTSHFLRNQAESYGELGKHLSSQALRVLQGHSWSGNVRELANVIEHAYVYAADRVITTRDLPAWLTSPEADDPLAGGNLRLLELERRTIAEALRRTRCRKTAACRLLGIPLKRLNRRISRLGIDLP